MRLIAVLVLVLAASGCRVPYSSDLVDMAVWPDGMPPAGTSQAELEAWFREAGYAKGPDVHQALANLMRRSGEPLVYAHASQKLWWHSAARSVRHSCVTTHHVYYRLSQDGSLDQAVQNHRSEC